LFNWGTFDGRVQRLVLGGGNGLLTGQVGAGKSTLVDGLTTLFASTNKVTFNRAAGADRSERSVASYVLGQYANTYDEATGSTKPERLRQKKDAYSALLARFTGAPNASRTLTAGVVFWFPGDVAMPQRLYFVAPSGFDIEGTLVGHTDVRAVRSALREAGADMHDNFRAYQKALCRQLAISSAALDLLVQTISMKQVGNLTDFVRTHMLDPADAKSRIDKILEHWADLNRAHELVVMAREQLRMLLPVVEQSAAYDRADARITASTAALAAVPAHVEQRRVSLLATAIAEIERQLPVLFAQAEAAGQRIRSQETRLTQLTVAVQAGGGAELANARNQVDAARDHLGDVQRALAELTALAARLGIPAPDGTADHTRFWSAVSGAVAELAVVAERLRTRDFDAQSDLATARRELTELRAEIDAAGTRDSNVPLDLAALRGRIATEVGLPAEAIPFAAELIAVADGAAQWEPAAERLLRSYALSMLVPEQHYPAVSAWVDATHLGQRLVYYRVPAGGVLSAPPREGAMAGYLQVRTGTPVSAWLRAEVNRRFDHVCVVDPAELADHPRAVTRAGQVKDNLRHDKDDRRRLDDRRHYVLGWDTAARRAALLAGLPAHETRVTELDAVVVAVGEERDDHGERHYAARQITERFADPQAVDIASAYDRLNDAEQLLETFVNRADLNELLEQQSRCQAELDQLRDDKDGLTKAVGAAEDRLNRCQQSHAVATRSLAETEAATLSLDATEALNEALLAAGAEPGVPEECDGWGRKLDDAIHARAESAKSTRDRVGLRLVGAMKDFAGQWPQAVTDIPTTEAASRHEFQALRDRLASDDLPTYEANFRDQLQTNAIHELVAFSAFLDREANEITGRIATINGALVDLDYQPGTYIRLEVERSSQPDVADFRRQLKDITSDALLGDDEAYAESRFLRVKDLLDRFRGRDGSSTHDLAWTARVTDVRNWFAFAASERTREEDVPVEHYTDSGGKSGGQKEKLAYTVLAASLSYQYGLAGGNAAAFRFVMIDEAFGRGSDESTRFGLELFTRLGLQLLVVTPLQKIATIEPFVDAVGYVSMKSPRSRLDSMTITDYHARLAAQRALLAEPR
ncbi:MAG: hypothetical protein QOG69_832, partial [Actinomycetota bacterium]|nr:hypothetical protein [Actinomycetota bacterium]